jgi:hypothetical protein
VEVVASAGAAIGTSAGPHLRLKMAILGKSGEPLSFNLSPRLIFIDSWTRQPSRDALLFDQQQASVWSSCTMSARKLGEFTMKGRLSAAPGVLSGTG